MKPVCAGHNLLNAGPKMGPWNASLHASQRKGQHVLLKARSNIRDDLASIYSHWCSAAGPFRWTTLPLPPPRRLPTYNTAHADQEE
jgi:hypothetical protein